jgi:hypothetical protein
MAELAQGERSLAGALPDELDRDRPHRGQPQSPSAAPAGLGSGVHRWPAEQLAEPGCNQGSAAVHNAV